MYVCTLKLGIARCRVDKSQKIMVRGCVHLNLALRGVELVMCEK
jgi:hypothetical protein